MVIPVGERYQQTLYLLKKTDGKMRSESLRADDLRAHDRQGRIAPQRSTRTNR